MIRILFKSKRYSFLRLSGLLETHFDEKLAGCLPETYPTLFTYDEKLSLLEILIDGVHDLELFRSFLTTQLEEHSAFNRQKMELNAELKSLEAQKSDLLKRQTSDNSEIVKK